VNGKIDDIYNTILDDAAHSDPGVFVTISFTALAKSGTSPLDLDEVIVIDYDGDPVIVDVNDGNVTVEPVVCYTLTINIVGSGFVTKDPEQATYHYGDNVQLNATAEDGWTFSDWSGDLVSTDNPSTITIDGNNVVTATFTDTILPKIADVILINSTPLDTNASYGWENVLCTVIDAGGVDEVKLFVTYPDSSTVGHPMNKNGDTYSYNTTFTVAGDYTCHIWAIDTSDNIATSTPETFLLPENWEMNDDRKCDISDLRKVSLQFGETGPDGWIRADYNNDGICDISDLRKVALCFGDTY